MKYNIALIIKYLYRVLSRNNNVFQNVANFNYWLLQNKNNYYKNIKYIPISPYQLFILVC